MSGQGHNAAAHLRSFLERIERLEEERKTIADDIADVYKELAGEGYDKDAAKIVLKIRKSKDGIEGYSAKSDVVDAYLAALGMLPEDPRAPAPARARENIEEFPRPATSKGDGGRPQRSDAAGAKSDGLHAIVGRAPDGWIQVGQSEQQQASAPQDRNSPVSESGAAATHPEPFVPPAFLRKTAAHYRPHCMNPTACAASGLKHCHACAKAAGELEPAA